MPLVRSKVRDQTLTTNPIRVILLLFLYSVSSFCFSQVQDDSLRLLASEQLEKGELVEALTLQLEALKNADPAEKPFILQDIGITLAMNGEYATAAEYFNNSKKLTKDSVLLARCHNNLGLVYKNLSSYKRAIQEYKNALYINLAIARHDGLAKNYINIGNVYRLLEQFDSAVIYLNGALHWCQGKADSAMVFNTLAATYLDNKHYDLASNYVDSGLSIATEKRTIADLHYNLFQIGKATKDYDKALQAFETYIELDTTLTGRNTKLRMAELTAHFEAELERQSLIAENQIQEAEMQKQRLWLWLLGVSSCLCLITIIILGHYLRKAWRESKVREFARTLIYGALKLHIRDLRVKYYLNEREGKVCYFMTLEKSIPEIAKELELSEKTVYGIIGKIKEKMGLNYIDELRKVLRGERDP